MNKLQSRIIILLMCILSIGLSACSNNEDSQEGQNSKDEAKVYFVYTLDTSTGYSMTRTTSTNEEVFNEFYAKIKTGDLVAESYDLTLTEVSSGAKYTFKGKWNSHDLVTLRTGTYKVVGTSTAEGENIQEKCSFIFNEQVEISITSKVITLHANYDSALLIFNNSDIQSLQNFNGTDLVSFFTFSTYKYAFVNGLLYQDSKKNEAYILGKYTDNAEFKIFTGNLNFEKGKYYVYNSVSNGFDIPPMDEGAYHVSLKSLNDYIAVSSLKLLEDGSNYKITPIIDGIKKIYIDWRKSTTDGTDCFLHIRNQDDTKYLAISSRGLESTSSHNLTLIKPNTQYLNIKKLANDNTYSWLYYNPSNSYEVIIDIEQYFGELGYIENFQKDFGTSCVVNIETIAN